MSVVLALQNLWEGHNRIPCNKNDAPAESRGTWRIFYTSSRIWIRLRFTLPLNTGKTQNDSGASSKSQIPEERELVVDSGASMHMLSKKNF